VHSAYVLCACFFARGSPPRTAGLRTPHTFVPRTRAHWFTRFLIVHAFTVRARGLALLSYLAAVGSLFSRLVAHGLPRSRTTFAHAVARGSPRCAHAHILPHSLPAALAALHCTDVLWLRSRFVYAPLAARFSRLRGFTLCVHGCTLAVALVHVYTAFGSFHYCVWFRLVTRSHLRFATRLHLLLVHTSHLRLRALPLRVARILRSLQFVACTVARSHAVHARFHAFVWFAATIHTAGCLALRCRSRSAFTFWLRLLRLRPRWFA